ncbi:MAG TPA: 16S rRNA (cytosine(1402)-N(4))-methyltransferase RsmH [Methylomirabilota bacterium]|jgi:16S rRNA (cytosine1402-N4)-methyltransferase|nr:16S rRNA (cytosine(1402)-N(4))-methyltransferase RsmH [Methylomirabilota bacterium]
MTDHDPQPAPEPHRPVLRDTVLHWLTPLPVGAWIVDGTVGLAGHAAALLEHATESRLLGLDRDATTLELAARRLAPFGARVVLRHADFRDIAHEAAACGVEVAHAILFDLGLSSYQLAHSGRGFSFQTDERLDMRFDTRQPLTAADLLRTTPEPDLARLLATYGEEPAARRIARRIVAARGRAPLTTTRALADLVVAAIPPHRRPRRIHPATRTFQALRIAVNDELGSLEAALPRAADLLAPRGRFGVIAFHSLEDRLVKRAFRRFAAEPGFRLATPKPVRPSADEVHDNPRARSARLRVLERS